MHSSSIFYFFVVRIERTKTKQNKTKQTKREREMPAGCKGEERSKFEQLVVPPQETDINVSSPMMIER